MSSSSTSEVPQSEFTLVSAMVAKARGDAEEAVSLAEKVLFMEGNGSNFEALVLRGKVSFERDRGGLADFLRAAKVNPGNPVPFLYLGHAYRARGGGDLGKARKCYQKSFHLDPGCTEAAVALSDVLRDQGAADANAAHLKSVVARSPSASDCRWAHVRLGVLYLSRELQDLTNVIWNYRVTMVVRD